MTTHSSYAKPGRRGRPRKNCQGLIERPREERSYKDFFPDLNIHEPLPILHSHISSDIPDRSTKTPLPIPSYTRLSQTEHIHGSPTPAHYIRYIEPSENELFETVEYDMDEQDEVWLEVLNKDRKKQELEEVSGEVFERVIDRLEKEWFNLIKSVPKKYECQTVLAEDAKCAVCDDGECENSNAIVFCDGCNLAVHQDCYGIPYIPEGQWLCRKCMVSPENPVQCLFCPREDGAFKQTTTNQWGHLICALWIPEVNLSNSVYMEPIDNVENIPRNRWGLRCSICKQRQGACIQCDHKNCVAAFHVTCARWARLCMRMKTHPEGTLAKAYCNKHTPRDYKEEVDVDKCIIEARGWFFNPNRERQMPHKRYIDEEDSDDCVYTDIVQEAPKKGRPPQKKNQALSHLLPTLKEARAHHHHFTAGGPVAPDYILHQLEGVIDSHQNATVKKSALIALISRYWSLKRESRRGTPLLKRLHLEPWTACSSQAKQSEVEKACKAAAMISLRADLERVRMLSEQVQKRERLKLDVMKKQKAYLEMILYPVEYIVRPVVDTLIELDKKGIFMDPVTAEVAPDYYDIIKGPMSFSTILHKMQSHAYASLDQIKCDLSLIWDNSMLYNKPDTAYHKLAQRMKSQCDILMVKAEEDYQSLVLNKYSLLLDADLDPDMLNGAMHSPPVSEYIHTPINDGVIVQIPTIHRRKRKDDGKRMNCSVSERNKRALRSRWVSPPIQKMTKPEKKTAKPSSVDPNINKINIDESIRVSLSPTMNTEVTSLLNHTMPHHTRSQEDKYPARQTRNSARHSALSETSPIKDTTSFIRKTRGRSLPKDALSKAPKQPSESIKEDTPPDTPKEVTEAEKTSSEVSSSVARKTRSKSEVPSVAAEVLTQQTNEREELEKDTTDSISHTETNQASHINEVSEVPIKQTRSQSKAPSTRKTRSAAYAKDDSERATNKVYSKEESAMKKADTPPEEVSVRKTRSSREVSQELTRKTRNSPGTSSKEISRKTRSSTHASSKETATDIIASTDTSIKETTTMTTDSIDTSVKEESFVQKTGTSDAVNGETTRKTRSSSNSPPKEDANKTTSSPEVSQETIRKTRSSSNSPPKEDANKTTSSPEVSQETIRKTRSSSNSPPKEDANKTTSSPEVSAKEAPTIRKTRSSPEASKGPTRKTRSSHQDLSKEPTATKTRSSPVTSDKEESKKTTNPSDAKKEPAKKTRSTSATNISSVIVDTSKEIPADTKTCSQSHVPKTTEEVPNVKATNGIQADQSKYSSRTTRSGVTADTQKKKDVMKTPPVKTTSQNSPPTTRSSTHKYPPRTTRSQASQGENKYPLRTHTEPSKIYPKTTKRKSTDEDTRNTKKVCRNLIKDGEFVWAQVPLFPYHPSRVTLQITNRVPTWVKEAKPDDDKILVEFFLVSELHTWCWVDRDNIFPFGDPDIDITMLKKAKKCKKIVRGKEVKKAYRHVCQLKNIDPLPQLEKVYR